MWLVYALAAAALWGLDYALNEKIFEAKITPYTLLILQSGLGLIIFSVAGIFSSILGQLRSDVALIYQNKNLFWLVIAALLASTLGNLLIFISIQAKNATLAGLVELSYPIFTIICSYLLFNISHLSWSVLAGGSLIFAGVLLIACFN